MDVLSAILGKKSKKNTIAPNRERRRMYWKKNHKKENLGTWDEFNRTLDKEKPFVK